MWPCDEGQSRGLKRNGAELQLNQALAGGPPVMVTRTQAGSEPAVTMELESMPQDRAQQGDGRDLDPS